MSEYKFGFIGVGNMGSALVRAAVKNLNPSSIVISNRSHEKADKLAAEIKCCWGENQYVALKSQYIFLGVKPQMLGSVFKEIAPVLAGRKDRFVVVSMAAGVEISSLSDMCGGKYPIIRIMPNTPCSVGKGVILCSVGNDVKNEEIDEFKNIMSSAGTIDFIDESLIDAGSAVSGCGPAFVYMFIEALADGGVECGLPRSVALKYAAQTVLGAADMVLKSGKHPGELKDAVCSPAGSTIKGVHALESGGFRNSAINAVCEAFKKTKDLGKNR